MRIHYIHPRGVHILNTKQQGVVQGEPRGPGTLQFLEQRKQACFQQTHNQGLLLLLSMSSTSAASVSHLTVPLILCSSESIWYMSRSLKGAVSAFKGLHKSETETRELLGGTVDNSVSGTRRSSIFFTNLPPPTEYLVACDLPATQYLFPAWEMKG